MNSSNNVQNNVANNVQNNRRRSRTLTLDNFDIFIQECQARNNYDRAVRLCGKICSNLFNLEYFFGQTKPIYRSEDYNVAGPSNSTNFIHVDVPNVRRIMKKLYLVHRAIFTTINNSFAKINFNSFLELNPEIKAVELICNVFVIIFEIVIVSPDDFLQSSIPLILAAINNLPTFGKARLAELWGKHCSESILAYVNIVQLALTQRKLDGGNEFANELNMLKILYFANILAGEIEPHKVCDPHKPVKTVFLNDQLALELNINVIDSRKPFIDFHKFYNIPYSRETAANMQLSKDLYQNWFVYPILFRINFQNIIIEKKKDKIHNFSNNILFIPNVILIIRRDFIVEDTFRQIRQMVASKSDELQRNLDIKFTDEPGLDQGGIRREYFQIFFETITQSEYEMFIILENGTVWFNSKQSIDLNKFNILGVLLGLAIYHGVLIPVHFSNVVYRKLLGIKATFNDLKNFDYVLYTNLEDMLNCPADVDMEDVYMQTFEINFKDAMGNVFSRALKTNGANIMVNHANKKVKIFKYL